MWHAQAYSWGTSAVPPTGFTEDQDASDGTDGWEIANLAQVSAGSTGTVTGAVYTGGSNSAAGVLFYGLKSISGGGGGGSSSIVHGKVRGKIKVRGKVKFR